MSPVLVQQAAEYQKRQADDKKHEVQRRSSQLTQEPVDITPKNGGQHIWSGVENLSAFEQEWSMKPVTMTGMFDHTQEFAV